MLVFHIPTIFLVLLFTALVPTADRVLDVEQSPTIWFIRPGADGDGTNSNTPLGSSEKLEAVSRPGDIIVLSPGEMPLDGGLELKAGQVLIGLADGESKPVVTNSDSTRNGGVGIVLADNNRIWNVRIEHTHSSGLFGKNVSGVVIDQVEVSDTNHSGSITEVGLNPLGVMPHGGIVFLHTTTGNTGINHISRTDITDARGIGIGSYSFDSAKSQLFVHDTRVEGGARAARFNMGILVFAGGASSEADLELTHATIHGRMEPNGRNVSVIASTDGIARGHIARSHLGEVGQDGILGIVFMAPATVELDINDTIVEKAGQTNIEGTITNLPPLDPSRAHEARVSIDVTKSIVRNAESTFTYEDDLIGTGNIWMGSSAAVQQAQPGSKAPFIPGHFSLNVQHSRIEGEEGFAIGAGNTGSDLGIGPDSGTFDIKLRDNIIASQTDVLLATPTASIDARQNCWASGEGFSEERIRLLENARRSQLDASNALPCSTLAAKKP